MRRGERSSWRLVPKLHLGMPLSAKFHFGGAERTRSTASGKRTFPSATWERVKKSEFLKLTPFKFTGKPLDCAINERHCASAAGQSATAIRHRARAAAQSAPFFPRSQVALGNALFPEAMLRVEGVSAGGECAHDLACGAPPPCEAQLRSKVRSQAQLGNELNELKRTTEPRNRVSAG